MTNSNNSSNVNSINFVASLKSSKGGKSSWSYEEDRIMLQCILDGIGGKEREEMLAPRSQAGFPAKKNQLLKMITESGATNPEEAYQALADKHGVKLEEVA
jgi:hypothetical protein